MAGVLRRELFASAPAFSFVDVERAAEGVLRDAHRQAAEILAAARKQANEEAAKIIAAGRIAGVAEGRQAGLEQIRKEATQSALQEARQQVGRLTHSLTVVLTEIEQSRNQLLASAETELIRLAAALARRICGLALETRPQTLSEIVKSTLELVRHEHDIELRLNVADLETLRALDPEFEQTLNAFTHLKLTGRDDLPRGGCQVHSRVGTIDASLDVQLERAARALLGDEAVA